MDRRHLETLAGTFGIWQHATGAVPDPRFGSCTDDVARALSVDILHARELGWDAVAPDARRSLDFLGAAWHPVTGRFANKRDASGAWLDSMGSDDTQGRALLALGDVLREPHDPAFVAEARALFARALTAALRLRPLRPVASCILGCVAALQGDALDDALRAETTTTVQRLTERLRTAFPSAGSAPDWPWPEAVLSYETAVLPHALLAGGRVAGDAEALRLGVEVLAWLVSVQRGDGDAFSPVGNRGWWRRGGDRARFGQQPIEAAALVMACATAFRQTADPRWLAEAERGYGWFLGDNDLRVPVADLVTGGCRDGLEADGVNVNQGAESTLVWLMAQEHLRALRRGTADGEATVAARAAPMAPLGVGSV